MTLEKLKQLRDLTLEYYMEVRDQNNSACRFAYALRTVYMGVDTEVSVQEGLKADDD